MNKKEIEIFQYDNIPLEYIQGNILEIGVNEQRLLQSRIQHKIARDNYLGVDIEPKNGLLNTIQADILEYKIKQKYDTILMIEVLEHIKLCYWEELLRKLKTALIPTGWLIISVPYKQKLSRYVFSSEFNVSKDQIHSVFGIDKKVIRKFLPNAKIKTIKRSWWRQDNASLIWATGRFVKRLLSNQNPIRKNLMIYWQKEGL